MRGHKDEMKTKIRIFLAVALVVMTILALGVGAAAADVSFTQIYTLADPAQADTKINTVEVDGELYVILPAGTCLEAVPLYFTVSDENAAVAAVGAKAATGLSSGESLNLPALCGKTDRYQITLRAKLGSNISEQKLTFIQTEGVEAIFLVSDDPVNRGRQWVESSPDKSNKATGSMVMQAEDGTIVYAGDLTQIKGRGNSTWNGAKKPYQIKLSSKTDLLQTGDSANRAKTWVLLANYFDSTLLRNSLTFDLAAAMQMDVALQYTPVNLYYDGEYRGAYMLSEKVEVGKGRVDIADLEDSNEAANPDVEDLADLETAQGKTANGATYVYCTGMKSPADITGGYLLELDFASRAQEEICYFVTTRGYYVVVKSPECSSKEEMDYIATLYQEFEDALFSGGVNSATGKSYDEYVALDSIVQCYLINELSKNPDGFHTSAFFYKDAGEDMMRMGPIWDYDLGYGISTGSNTESAKDPEGFYTLYDRIGQTLYKLPDFRMEVKRQYQEVVAPLISNVLYGAAGSVSADGSLHTFDYYVDRIHDSAVCDAMIWTEPHNYTANQPAGTQWEPNVAYLKSYIEKRNAWLLKNFSEWKEDSYQTLGRFMDVNPQIWYFEYVEQAATYGLMNGQGNGTFAPTRPITRAETAMVLYNLEPRQSFVVQQVFPDVSLSAWYATCVQWAYENEVVTGLPDGTYLPNEGISRQDMVTLLYRYEGEPKVTGGHCAQFTDGNTVATHAKNAMEWAIENGIITGNPDKTLTPRNTISRAEFAAVIVRYYEMDRG